MSEKVFWLEDWEGTVEGGYFLKSKLPDFMKRFKDEGLKPVGIRIDDDNKIEVIIEATGNVSGDKEPYLH